MLSIPAIHSWNLTNYARRLKLNSTVKNEYFWSCLDVNQTSLKMIVTPALQLLVISSDLCVEELIDIWFLLNVLHVHVHRKSVLFNYAWPSSVTNSIRSFRIKFNNDDDLNQCLQFLRNYFPIKIYSSDDSIICTESTKPTMFHSMFFNEIKQTLTLEQSTTMNIRADFIRQYLSTCVMDPMFFSFVDKSEQYLKMMLVEK